MAGGLAFLLAGVMAINVSKHHALATHRTPNVSKHHASAADTSVAFLARACVPPTGHTYAIAFIGTEHEFRSWEAYESGHGYCGSETYWSSAVSFVLRAMNVTVHYHPSTPLPPLRMADEPGHNASNAKMLGALNADANIILKVARHKQYDRFVLAGYSEFRLAVLKRALPADIFCRTRIMSWWGGGDSHRLKILMDQQQHKRGANLYSQYMQQQLPREFVSPRLVIYPHAHPYGTAVPYFPHSLVTSEPSTNASRPRRGFLLAKSCTSQSGLLADPHIRSLVDALLSAGFELHMTARCPPQMGLPKELVSRGMRPPAEFALLLRSMAFLVGIGSIDATPSPLEAIANGAAFLNPRNRSASGGPYHYQHPFIADLGAPYVYNYDIDDASSLVAAAESAWRRRFASYVPPQHRIEAVASSACALLLQDDAPCHCAAARAARDHLYPCPPEVATSAWEGALPFDKELASEIMRGERAAPV